MRFVADSSLLVRLYLHDSSSGSLSFDRHSRQRPLPAAAGLRLWPPLEKDEKGLAKQASLQAGS